MFARLAVCGLPVIGLLHQARTVVRNDGKARDCYDLALATTDLTATPAAVIERHASRSLVHRSNDRRR